MTFGEYVRAARLAAGLSLRNMAREMGVSHVFVSEVERGTRALPRRRWPRLLELLPDLREEQLERLDRLRGPAVITCDPRVRSGWPCIAGTRIGVEHVASRVRAGDPVEVVARDYEVEPAVISVAVEVYEGMRPLFEALDVATLLLGPSRPLTRLAQLGVRTTRRRRRFRP